MNLVKYTLDDFSKGFMANTSPDAMKKGATPKSYNVEALRGSLKTVNGYSKAVTAQITYNGDTYIPELIMTYYSSSSTSLKNNDIMPIVADANGNKGIFVYKNNAWQLLKGNISDASMGYVNYYRNDENYLLISNAIDGLYKLSNNTITYLGVNTPVMSTMTLHYERVWGIGDPDKPNTVYYSASGNPELWDTDESDAGETSITTYDGDKFIAIDTVFDDVVLYRQKSLFRISGTSTENYRLTKIPSECGACGPNAVANDGKNSFFVGTDGIYEYNGASAKKILGDGLNLFFKEWVNTSAMWYCSAQIFAGKLLVALPIDESEKNNCIIEYDISAKIVNIRVDVNAKDLTVFADKLYFLDSNGNICVFDDSTKYATKNIEAYYETPYTDFDGKNTLKTLDSIYFTAKGDGKLAVSSVTEYGKVKKYVELTDSDEYNLYKIDMYNEGRRYKFLFENYEGSSFEITDPEFILEVDEED